MRTHLSEGLDRLGLASACGAIGVATQPKGHALCQREEAAVRERRPHQLRSGALVLPRVLKLCVHHVCRHLH